jgi:DNA-binding NarL/FixJ family response regulator
MGKRRIFLVDDHPIVRDGLAQLINADSDLEVCGCASGVDEALAALETADAELVVIDIALKQGSGLDLLKALRDRSKDILTLVLSMHDERYYAPRALRAGARGYVMKQEASDVVVDAIHRILNGQLYVSEHLNSMIIENYVGGRSAFGVESLSDRELQVLEMTALGRSIAEIGEELGISSKTVETYRLRLRKKLQLQDAVALLNFGVRWLEQRDTE